jgi:putative peptidoglycan lipid II flippase
MSKKFSSTVAGGAIIITFFSFIGRGLGIIREAVFANYFGLTTNYDLYLIGAVLPITINSIIHYLAQNFYIPNYKKVKSVSDQKAQRFRSVAFVGFTLLGLIIAVILFSITDQIIKLYVQNANFENLIIAKNVFNIFIFTIPFSFSTAILSAILNADFEFKFPSFSQLYLNLAIILVVLFFADSIGIFSIAWGYLIGTLLQFIYLYYKTNHISAIRFRNLHLSELTSFLSLSFFLIIFIESIGQIYSLADRFLYHRVDSGGIAALNYALIIFLIPISIFSLSLSTAILPKLSEILGDGSIEEKSENIKHYFGVNLFLIVPITLILLFQGDFIVKILFERGQFNPGDSKITFSAMQFYALSLIFYSSYAGINKLAYSSGLIKELFLVALFACIIKVVLNFILVDPMKQNGLALSSSLSFFFLFLGTYFITLTNKLIVSKAYFTQQLVINLTNGVFSYMISMILFSNIFHKSNLVEISQIILFILIYISIAKFTDQYYLNVYAETFKKIINIKPYLKRS